MRYAHNLQCTFVRTIRKRSSQKPADFLSNATTFADTHTVLNDPFTPLPYPEQQLFHFLNETKEADREMKLRKKARIVPMQKIRGSLVFDHIPIERQIVMLFPGQGDQQVGMGRHLKRCRASMEVYEKASALLGYDIWDLCQTGPKSKIDQVIYCHPALFVTKMAAIEVLKTEVEDFEERVTEVAGFGVGEFCALVAGGIMKFEDALEVVAQQSRIINDCNQLTSCSTFTVQVNAASELDQAISFVKEKALEEGEIPLCELAGNLYCGVKILGASKLCKKLLLQNSEQFKIKILNDLPVIGSPYTSLMQPGEPELAEKLKKLEYCVFHPKNVYSNFLGKVYPRQRSSIRTCIMRQFSTPVKWEQIMQLLYRKHQDYKFPSFYEVGSSKQLGKTLFQTSKKAHQHYYNFLC